MEFDYESERCYDCDGHWKHASWCPWVTGESTTPEDAGMEAGLFGGDC